jgi:O-antigen ligase
MFKDKKLIGHGINAFRYLCIQKPYNVEKEIIEHYTILSPVNGTFIKADNLKDKSGNLLTRYIVLDQSGKKYEIKITSEKVHKYLFVSEGSNVKKNQPLISIYEYNSGCNTHPHNIYLQFLAELGIIGFCLLSILFIFILLKLFKYSFKKLNGNLTNKEKCLSLILFGSFMFMCPILPSGNFFNNWLLIITFLPIGFYLSLVENSND